MASAGTSTSALDLQGSWPSVYLAIPTMTSNTQINIQASDSLAGTYRRLKHPTLNSSTVGTNEFAIVSGATNCIVPIPDSLRFIKVETTATVDNGCTFKILCGTV